MNMLNEHNFMHRAFVDMLKIYNIETSVELDEAFYCGALTVLVTLQHTMDSPTHFKAATKIMVTEVNKKMEEMDERRNRIRKSQAN